MPGTLQTARMANPVELTVQPKGLVQYPLKSVGIPLLNSAGIGSGPKLGATAVGAETQSLGAAAIRGHRSTYIGYIQAHCYFFLRYIIGRE